tara:strand:- start:2370 stop:2606 length:237 start_codon:yes stop_codon:yes gene_type:complete
MSILDQVKQTIADTLNTSSSSITKDSSAENTDAWDSLAQVNLMIALEQTFDITLDVEDFMKLNSVKSITKFIEENTES